MNYSHNEKEELIAKIEELKRENNSLKKTIERNTFGGNKYRDLGVAQQKADENELQFRMLFQNAADAIFIAEIESGVIVDANLAAERLLKLPHNNIVGIHHSELHPPNRKKYGADTFQKHTLEVTEQKNISLFENQIIRSDGSEVTVEILASEVRHQGKKCLMGIFRDITDRKKTELELLEAKDAAEANNANITAILEGTNDSIWAFNRNYEILYINPVFQQDFLQSFGVHLEPGVNLVDSLPNALRPLWKPRYDRVLANEQFLIEDAVPTDNGILYIQVKFNPIVKKGRVVGGSCFGSNITPRKLAELELVKAKEKAEESDRLKSAFLQNMSHEIRTPMNSIMGFSSLLVNNNNDAQAVERYSEIINNSCSDLLEIINDILDISKIESGQLIVNEEECNVVELFDELSIFFSELQDRLSKQHIKLIFSFQSDQAYARIKTDKIKLKQILINLIGNAFKFTESGSIECRCRFESTQLHFQVLDTGVGIPEDKKYYVFERFSQIHHPSIKNIGGTGLGLSIAMGLSGLLGGRMWLESSSATLINGTPASSDFHFTINYIKTDSIQRHPANNSSNQEFNFENKTVLIVEDDVYNAIYLKEILANSGLNIITTQYAKDAIKIALSQTVDIVLMDVRLPDLSGYEATNFILQSNPNMKIIAQTAYAAQEERQKALEAGCLDYISKPINRNLLLKLISKYLIVN